MLCSIPVSVITATLWGSKAQTTAWLLNVPKAHFPLHNTPDDMVCLVIINIFVIVRISHRATVFTDPGNLLPEWKSREDAHHVSKAMIKANLQLRLFTFIETRWANSRKCQIVTKCHESELGQAFKKDTFECAEELPNWICELNQLIERIWIKRTIG